MYLVEPIFKVGLLAAPVGLNHCVRRSQTAFVFWGRRV